MEGEESINKKRKPRPAQRFYVPPAQRRKPPCSEIERVPELPAQAVNTNVPDVRKEEIQADTNPVQFESLDCKILENSESGVTNAASEDEKLVILLQNIRLAPDRNEEGADKEETAQVKRKSQKIKPLADKDNVLQIDVKKTSNKSIKKSPVKLLQVANWEDLFLEEDDGREQYLNEANLQTRQDTRSDEDECVVRDDPKLLELEHVIELYDFPSSLKAHDIMQIYNDCNINKDSMYIKWCDETHALLVLGSSIQARHALELKHDIVKSRPITMASRLVLQTALKSDLRPAMKRPQTNMQTARRMITSALGAKTRISRELQEKEREELRRAKELKRTQRQNERDAWEGKPRQTVA